MKAASLVIVVLTILIVGCFCQPEMKATPMGRIPSECVHSVPIGSKVLDRDDGAYVVEPNGKLSKLEECKYDYHNLIALHQYQRKLKASDPQEYDGWLAYTSFLQPSNKSFDAFLGYFSVPNKPQFDPEVLYIFTGLQNNDWVPLVDPEPPVFDIIQPVLQYPADVSNEWSVKSWYVTLRSGVVVSHEIIVPVGDNIFGNMTRLSGNDWYIAGVSSSTGKTASISVNRERLSSQPWSYNTIECYGCGGGCNYLPTNQCSFTKLQLISNGQVISANWKPFTTPNPVCHTHATINSPAQVTFTFQ